MGQSDAPDLGYGMAMYAADLAALLDALGVDDVILCGHSMGGYIAFEFLRTWRSRVRGLILIDSRADDLLNIDVTKNRIQLSEIAADQLKGLAGEAVKKSKAAWNAAKRNTEAIVSRTPHDEANEELDKISKLEDKSDELDESVAPGPEQEKLKERREAAVADKPVSADSGTMLTGCTTDVAGACAVMVPAPACPLKATASPNTIAS